MSTLSHISVLPATPEEQSVTVHFRTPDATISVKLASGEVPRDRDAAVRKALDAMLRLAAQNNAPPPRDMMVTVPGSVFQSWAYAR